MKFCDHITQPFVIDPQTATLNSEIRWSLWDAVKTKLETWRAVYLVDADTLRYVEVLDVSQTAPGSYEGNALVTPSCVPVSFTERQIFMVFIKPA